jgi:hypothetical protein
LGKEALRGKDLAESPNLQQRRIWRLLISLLQVPHQVKDFVFLANIV